MPSQTHETLIEMFRGRPALAADVLDRTLRIPVPEFDEALLASAELADVAPTEYRADAVVTLSRAGVAVLAVIIEVQLRVDQRKRLSWPAYVGTLYARVGCPVALLVVCPHPKIATWAATAIAVGPPGSTVAPIALGPEQIPVVTDPDEARSSPELAVMSTLAHLAHITDSERTALLNATFTGLDTIEPSRAALYTDLMLAVMPQAARKLLEDYMITTDNPYQSDFARRYFAAGEARGEARGEAKSVLAVLHARGIETPESFRAKLMACTDEALLARLIQQAATAEQLGDLDPVD
ncbi:hypothetical protein ACWT_7234 [Actinoplanes sp. SE50]|uniref:hypothetical protein n=1 Tax=unclassified Actinoplanes TaxID=2626549 RepID=UPI00023EDEDC|nr:MULTISPECIES: hypothetical protein [unclassified Actinoplanes]AEV88244.1 hypothetical protein ACPL_7364 [Actinoplanes sp. SE50/110]ATO86649.1 hypothetical protein ACWT_7234 [Actinoplanes sp. SE50]SLM04066.1 hypothetical protein ACSP50_7368 [Actinoplanes sp. SE50/110]